MAYFNLSFQEFEKLTLEEVMIAEQVRQHIEAENDIRQCNNLMFPNLKAGKRKQYINNLKRQLIKNVKSLKKVSTKELFGAITGGKVGKS